MSWLLLGALAFLLALGLLWYEREHLKKAHKLGKKET